MRREGVLAQEPRAEAVDRRNVGPIECQCFFDLSSVERAWRMRWRISLAAASVKVTATMRSGRTLPSAIHPLRVVSMR